MLPMHPIQIVRSSWSTWCCFSHGILSAQKKQNGGLQWFVNNINLFFYLFFLVTQEFIFGPSKTIRTYRFIPFWIRTPDSPPNEVYASVTTVGLATLRPIASMHFQLDTHFSASPAKQWLTGQLQIQREPHWNADGRSAFSWAYPAPCQWWCTVSGIKQGIMLYFWGYYILDSDTVFHICAHFQVTFVLPFRSMARSSMKPFATPLACDSFKRTKT